MPFRGAMSATSLPPSPSSCNLVSPASGEMSVMRLKFSLILVVGVVGVFLLASTDVVTLVEDIRKI